MLARFEGSSEGGDVDEGDDASEGEGSEQEGKATDIEKQKSANSEDILSTKPTKVAPLGAPGESQKNLDIVTSVTAAGHLEQHNIQKEKVSFQHAREDT